VAKFHTWRQKGEGRGRCKWDLSKGLIILLKKSTKITIFEGGKKKKRKKRVHTYSHI
jgi:hypothetical protein